MRRPGVCPSGQRERAVNPSAQPTEVRILPPPFRRQASCRIRARRRQTGFRCASSSGRAGRVDGGAVSASSGRLTRAAGTRRFIVGTGGGQFSSDRPPLKPRSGVRAPAADRGGGRTGPAFAGNPVQAAPPAPPPLARGQGEAGPHFSSAWSQTGLPGATLAGCSFSVRNFLGSYLVERLPRGLHSLCGERRRRCNPRPVATRAT
jgi:hypothetical protein